MHTRSPSNPEQLRRTVGLAATALLLLLSSCSSIRGHADARRVSVEMDPALRAGFFSMPWPNEVRRGRSGGIDLVGLPEAASGPLATVARSISETVDGAGTNAAVYLRFTGPLDRRSLPTPAASTLPSSPIQMVNLADPADRVPVVSQVEPVDAGRPTNLLSVMPYPGHGLRPASRYAVIVTTSLRASNGRPVVPSPLLGRLGDPPTAGSGTDRAAVGATLRAQRDEVVRVVRRLGGIHGARLAGFTVFRTQDSTALLRAMSATISRLPPAPLHLPRGGCRPGSGSIRLSGTVDLPAFQTGDAPFLTAGGAVQIAQDGTAVRQGTRRTPLLISVPCGPEPSIGWPLVTFVDGTGGAPTLGWASQLATTAVIASIPPRFGIGDPDGHDATGLLFYNVLNPAAARSNPLQQAADGLALLRSVASFTLDRPTDGSTYRVRTDPSRVIVSGQSQGAQTLPLIASQRPGTAVIAGSGTAGFYNSVSYRAAIRKVLAQVFAIRHLDVRSPVVQAIETLLDAAEPSNYPTTAPFLNIAGLRDGCVPLEAARHLSNSQRLTVLNPQMPPLLGEPALDAPRARRRFVGNRVSIEQPGGHFGLEANRTLAAEFARSVLAGRTPTLRAETIASDNLPQPESCRRSGPIVVAARDHSG